MYYHAYSIKLVYAYCFIYSQDCCIYTIVSGALLLLENILSINEKHIHTFYIVFKPHSDIHVYSIHAYNAEFTHKTRRVDHYKSV
jgi:hypothetical protein